MTDDEPPISISALEHYVYCPRQCALIHVDGQWDDNAHTIRGTRGHRRVDTGDDRTERGHKLLRGLPLWSERLNLTGRADAVELHPDGAIVPVEYKIGVRHGDAAAVQLCAQALCLEEMFGHAVLHGVVWFASPRRRERIEIDTSLRSRTESALAEIQANLHAQHLPPAVNDERCVQCQLRDSCLPELVADPDRVEHLTAELFQCDS